MKIAKTYHMYSIITIILAVFIMVLAWTIGKQDVQVQVRQEYKRVFDRYQAILALKNSAFEKTTYDYSYWDELVAFVKNPDVSWSTTNLLPLEKTFGISHIFIFDKHKKPIFTHPQDATTLMVSLDSIDENTPLFKEFFHVQNHRLFKFHLAPIQFSEDINRTGAPQGFLLFGQEWNSSFFESLEKIALGKATFLPLDVHDKNTYATHEYHIPLLSIQEKPVGYLDIVFESFLIEFAKKMQNSLILVSILAGLFVFTLLYLLTQKLIFKPIKPSFRTTFTI